MVKLTKKEVFRLNKGLKMHLLINDIADAFNQSYQDVIMISKDINNNQFDMTLSEATKKRKGHGKPLLDKGKMKNTWIKKRATNEKRVAIISTNKRERGVPSIVHNEGLGGFPKREWFGVGIVQIKIAINEQIKHIRNALR